ncbi:hypothetical protein ABIC83_002748 [Roseateles asaccharophilus]|uniref:hypothetical protein n=1 Tax=Roseateles asaccharophilus TaxID=582607 RepID=UPI00383748A2
MNPVPNLQLSTLSDRWSPDSTDAHAQLLYVLFDLAIESEVDARQVADAVEGCIEFARRGDPCHLGDIQDAAVLKFINCSWGQHQVIHDALAKVFAAYVQHGVIDLARPLRKMTKVNWGNLNLLNQAIQHGSLETAEQMVLHGGKVLKNKGDEAELDLHEYTSRLFGIQGPVNGNRGKDARARAAARLVEASMNRGIRGSLAANEPAPQAAADSRRPRMGL